MHSNFMPCVPSVAQGKIPLCNYMKLTIILIYVYTKRTFYANCSNERINPNCHNYRVPSLLNGILREQLAYNLALMLHT